MGLQEFKIFFNKPDASYIPGETVTGKVSLIIDSAEAFKEINITIEGVANVSWSGSRIAGCYRVEYANEEKYLNTQFDILKSPEKKVELPPGSYTYPFEFNLPSNLPSSFESDFGHIRYTIKATIGCINQHSSFDQDVKETFTIISSLDLNHLPYASETELIGKSKKFCCLCFGSPLSITLLLPVKGYVPKQIMLITVHVYNDSGVVIDAVKMILQKCVTYIAKSSRKKIKLAVSEVSRGPIMGREISAYQEKLEVPTLPPSGFEHCKIIDLKYELKIKFFVHGRHRRNMSFKFPIVIGTVPLVNYVQSTYEMGEAVRYSLDPSSPRHYIHTLLSAQNSEESINSQMDRQILRGGV